MSTTTQVPQQLVSELQNAVDKFEQSKVLLAASIIETLKGFAETIKNSCPKKTVSATGYVTDFMEAYEVTPNVFYSDASEFGTLFLTYLYTKLTGAEFVIKLGDSPEKDLEHLPRLINSVFQKYFPNQKPPSVSTIG